MKAIDCVRILGAALVCQVMAPLMVLDLPSIRKITVKSVTTRDPFKANTVSHISPDGRTTVFNVHPEPDGKKTVITLESSDRKGNVLLDHADFSIQSMAPVYWYSGYEHTSSGDLGVAVVGLPGIILASPILAINALVWYLIKLCTDMDRHALSFYLRIMNQLDDETRLLLKNALKKL